MYLLDHVTIQDYNVTLLYEYAVPWSVLQRQEDLMAVFTEHWDLQKNAEKKEKERFLLSGRGGNALGYPLDDDNFIVLSGSKISKDVTEGLGQGYLDLRNSLIADGTIVDGVFERDHTFTSSSAAASVVLGRAANGRKEWTLLDGRTYGKYGQLEREK